MKMMKLKKRKRKRMMMDEVKVEEGQVGVEVQEEVEERKLG